MRLQFSNAVICKQTKKPVIYFENENDEVWRHITYQRFDTNIRKHQWWIKLPLTPPEPRRGYELKKNDFGPNLKYALFDQLTNDPDPNDLRSKSSETEPKLSAKEHQEFFTPAKFKIFRTIKGESFVFDTDDCYTPSPNPPKKSRVYVVQQKKVTSAVPNFPKGDDQKAAERMRIGDPKAQVNLSASDTVETTRNKRPRDAGEAAVSSKLSRVKLPEMTSHSNPPMRGGIINWIVEYVEGNQKAAQSFVTKDEAEQYARDIGRTHRVLEIFHI